jgi:hypothetical protein
MPFDLDLSEYGYDIRLNLEGRIVEQQNNHKHLVFLFDERHTYFEGIQQSLRNALNLIDNNIVEFVGLEGLIYPYEAEPQLVIKNQKNGKR